MGDLSGVGVASISATTADTGDGVDSIVGAGTRGGCAAGRGSAVCGGDQVDSGVCDGVEPPSGVGAPAEDSADTGGKTCFSLSEKEGVGDAVAVGRFSMEGAGVDRGGWLFEWTLFSVIGGGSTLASKSTASSPQPVSRNIQRPAVSRAQPVKDLGTRIRLKFSVRVKVLSLGAARPAKVKPPYLPNQAGISRHAVSCVLNYRCLWNITLVLLGQYAGVGIARLQKSAKGEHQRFCP